MSWFRTGAGSGGGSFFPAELQARIDALENDQFLVCSLNSGDAAAQQEYQWNTMTFVTDNHERALRSGNYMKYAIIVDATKVTKDIRAFNISNVNNYDFLIVKNDGNLLGADSVNYFDRNTDKYMIAVACRNANSGCGYIQPYYSN